MTAEAAAAPASALPYGRLVPVTVHFDDLDALGLLHNARYPVLVERAWGELWEGRRTATGTRVTGPRPATPATRSGNCGSPTRRRSPGPAGTPSTCGRTGLTYGFRFCSADGATTYARGTRVLVRLDAATMRPAPWSEGFRAVGRELLRPAD